MVHTIFSKDSAVHFHTFFNPLKLCVSGRTKCTFHKASGSIPNEASALIFGNRLKSHFF